MAKSQARALLSHALCAPGQHTAKRLKSARENAETIDKDRICSSGDVFAEGHTKTRTQTRSSRPLGWLLRRSINDIHRVTVT